jgi:transglutaminase-like putative cysteine protease
MMKMRQLSGDFNGLEEKLRFIFRAYPKSITDPRLRKMTETLAGRGTRFEQADNLFRGLKQIVAYLPDPYGIEMTKTPSVMLDDYKARGFMSGDCDDLSSFAYTALMSIGIPAGLRVRWLRGKIQGPPDHIYTYALIMGQKYPFDLASKTLTFGQENAGAYTEDFQ